MLAWNTTRRTVPLASPPATMPSPSVEKRSTLVGAPGVKLSNWKGAAAWTEPST